MTEFLGLSLTEENLMRVFVLATVLLASSASHPSFAQRKEKPRLQPHKQLLPSLTRTPSSGGINEPTATNRRPTTVRWVATG